MMKLVIRNIIIDDMEGMKAIQFCTNRGLEPREKISSLHNEIVVEFDVKEVMENPFLQIIFSNSCLVEIDNDRYSISRKKRTLWDFEKDGGIKFTINEDSEINCEVVDKFKVINTLEKIIKDIDKLQVYYNMNGREFGIDNLEEFFNSEYYIIHSNFGKLDKKFFDKGVIDKLMQLERNKRTLICIDKKQIFKDVDYVILYIDCGEPRINTNNYDLALSEFIESMEDDIIDYENEDNFCLCIGKEYAKDVLIQLTLIDSVYCSTHITIDKRDDLNRIKWLKEMINETYFFNPFEEIKEEVNEDGIKAIKLSLALSFGEIIKTIKAKDEYAPKNMLWLIKAIYNSKPQDFCYLKGNDSESCYYDLVTLDYLGKKFALPVPILSKWTNIRDEEIKSYFKNIQKRDNVKFI